MHKVYDYRHRGEDMMREAEEKMKQRTPEEVEADELGKKEGWQELRSYMDMKEKKFCRRPSQKKRQDFLNTAALLREFADMHDGLLEIDITDHVGKIELTLECIQHTYDPIDPTRFILAFLFLHYEGISIFPAEHELCIQIVESLFDELPNSSD